MFNDISIKIKLLFCKDRELYVLLHKIIGCYPSRLEYYREALIHRSVQQKNEKGKMINNERLEFLGDAILDAAVADIVYHHFPNKREGFLTNTRAKIVQREHLNKLGRELGLDSLIRSSAHIQSHNSYLYGNTLEALVGAIYLDKGYDYSIKFIKSRIIDKSLEEVAKEEVNYKSKLIEWTQKYKVTIEFPLIDTFLDEKKSPVFKSGVVVSGIFVCEGNGYTKKESHQDASKQAYLRIISDSTLRDHILVDTE